MSHFYALTLRKCSGVKTSKQAKKVIKEYLFWYTEYMLHQDGKQKVNYTFEFVQEHGINNLHMHLCISSDTVICPPNKHKGWHIYFKICDDAYGIAWSKYIQKQDLKLEDVYKLLDNKKEKLCPGEVYKYIPPLIEQRAQNPDAISDDSSSDAAPMNGQSPRIKIPNKKLF